MDLLLHEIDSLAVDDQVHGALQRLVVGGAQELQELCSSAHDSTDNDSESSAGAASAAAASPTMYKKRKRKFTYIARKRVLAVYWQEEKSELLREIEELQERVRKFDGPRASAFEALTASKRENALLRESARSQQLSLASAQSIVSGLLTCEQSNPMSTTHIRLGTDWDDRRKTLLTMKSRAIHHTCEYVDTRSRFLDPLKRQVSEERFETATGDFCCSRYDIYQFTNVTSVGQVYSALLQYFQSIEISVSERLGDITTRDDLDFVENSVASFRFLSTDHGVPVEKHGVMFMEFFESHELFNGEPCGVVAIDHVEADELYPYTPFERLRKDINVAIVLTPHWREDALGRKELVVSMAMGKFKMLHVSKYHGATPEALEHMRESTMGWGIAMIATIRDILSQTSHQSYETMESYAHAMLDEAQQHALLEELDPLADNRMHVALQRLVVGDDDAMGDEELQNSSSMHDSTDNDSEASVSITSSATRARKSTPVTAAVVPPISEHKKRKAAVPTYRARKEEKNELLSEIETLHARLTLLETQKARSTLAGAERDNALLHEFLRSQQLSLATSQCVISGLLTGEHSNPQSTNYIHLGTDWEGRRNTLLGIKERTIHHACEYVEARSRLLDPFKRHVSGERFENASGDFCCTQFDLRQYANVTDVKQVFDALIAYLFNIEISVSEHLGDITTRDDFDFVENSFASFRFLTTEFDVPVEKHGVLFMEYFESHELFGGHAGGVIVVDRVEHDELYPYTPQERLRKDMNVVIVLRPYLQEGAEPVMSLAMANYVKLHRSECSLATPKAVEQIRKNVASWGGVMTEAMEEIMNQHVA